MTCARCADLEAEVKQLRMALRTLAECPAGTKEQKAKRQMTMTDRRSPHATDTKEKR